MQPTEAKDLVFIVSGGRTGTTFLGTYLSDVIEDAFSVHEPDMLEGFTRRSMKAIQDFGLYHMVIGRLLGRTGIRNLCQKYLAGRLSRSQAKEAVLTHRQRYYQGIDASLIIEAYYQWFGLLPVLEDVYPDAKVVAIVRDPRTWVRSWINYGRHYGKRDNVARAGQRRLEPAMIGDEKYAARWETMSPFARNCWHWKVITQLMLEACEHSDKAQMFSFEDLFQAEDREVHIRKLLDFIVDFGDHKHSYRLPDGVFDRVTNASDDSVMAAWADWPADQRQELEDICGPLMRQLGYGLEPEWNDAPA